MAKKGGSRSSDRQIAAALVRIQKAKRSATIMKRARGMGLSTHPGSKFGIHYVPAGTPEGVARFGASFRDANEAQRAERKAQQYYGRGEYWGKGIGGLIGGAIPIPGAGAVFSGIGDKIGDWFKRKFTGRGLYDGRGMYEGRGAYIHPAHGANNSLIAGGQPGMKFSGAGDETSGLTVSHTEFIGDVYAPSTSSWNVTNYPLNPGLQEVFPQLSQLAVNFEEYEFIQLIFHYRSTVDSSSTNNASGNTGTVVMATDYASSVQSFKDKAQMVSTHGAVSERITEAINHGVECDPEKNMGSAQKTVRTGLIRDRDVSTLDLGKFQIAFQNTPSAFFNQQVGELWVTYQVKLDKPRIYSAASGNVAFYRGVSKGGESTANILGTNWLTCQSNSLALQVSHSAAANAGFLVAFPAAANGVYEVRCCVEGTGLTQVANTGPSFVRTGNVAPYNDMYASEANGVDSPSLFWSTANGTTAVVICRVQVQAASGGLNNTVFVPCVNGGTLTQTHIDVIEVSPFLAQSNSNPAPIYIDALGVITNP